MSNPEKAGEVEKRKQSLRGWCACAYRTPRLLAAKPLRPLRPTPALWRASSSDSPPSTAARTRHCVIHNQSYHISRPISRTCMHARAPHKVWQSDLLILARHGAVTVRACMLPDQSQIVSYARERDSKLTYVTALPRRRPSSGRCC